MGGWLFKKEQQKYAKWMSQQSPAVDRRAYTRPAGILRRDDHVRNDETTAYEEEVDIFIERNDNESNQTEIGRAHDLRNNAGLSNETTTRRSPGNSTPARKMCSATCTGSDSGSIDICYSAQPDELSAADGQVDTEPVPSSRLDDLRNDRRQAGADHSLMT